MFNRTAKLETYKAIVKTTPGNCGYVSVLKRSTKNTFQSYWTFMPTPNHPPLEYATVIHPDRLITIDRSCTFRLFDLNQKKELFSAFQEAAFFLGAGVYPSGEKGVIALKGKDPAPVELYEFEIITPAIKKRISFSDINDLKSVTVLAESLIAAYLPLGSREELFASDGFILIDLENNTKKLFPLKPAPTGNFSTPAIAFDPRTKTGIRPAYEPIETVTENNVTRYRAKVLLFDLMTGRKIRTVTIREFAADEMFEDDNPTYALSCFDLPPYTDDYKDLRDEFLERIEAFQFCQTEPAFWVTFQHGLVRKIGLNGDYLSPLIAHPGELKYYEVNPLHRAGFSTPLQLSPDDRFVTFGEPPATFEAISIAGMDLHTPFVLSSMLIQEDNALPENDIELAFSWQMLAVETLEKPSAIKHTLLHLIEITKHIDQFRDGPYLRFLFRSQGKTLSEAEFFQATCHQAELLILVRNVLVNYLDFKTALRYDDTTPALLEAVRALVLSNADFLDEFVKYTGLVEEITADTDKLGKLIEETIGRYGWREETIDLILTRATFQPEKGLDQLATYLDQPDFQFYLAEPAQHRYFYQHTLFLSLAEEHFSLFFPAEERLFAAVEAEEKGEVEELLRLHLDLELIHPEFNLSVLDLAVETGNKKIVQLLLAAGSKLSDPGLSGLENISDESPNITGRAENSQHDLLEELTRHFEKVQEEIHTIEFDHMLNFFLSPEQAEFLRLKNIELQTLLTRINYAKLGRKQDPPIPIGKSAHPFSNSDAFKDSGVESYITENSYFFEDLAAATVFIEDFTENGQLQAFSQMQKLLQQPDKLIVDQVLRFHFKQGDRFISEKDYYEKICLTSQSANSLAELLKKLFGVNQKPLWHDDENPCCFYAIQKLALFQDGYLALLIHYLQAGIVESDEPDCITELMFEIYDRYGWNPSTLSLVIFRLSKADGTNGLNEFRMQWKKGGLAEFMQDEAHRDAFFERLNRDCGEQRSEWCKRLLRSF